MVCGDVEGGTERSHHGQQPLMRRRGRRARRTGIGESVVGFAGGEEEARRTEASGRHAEREPRMTTVPERRSRMWGRTALVTLRTPKRLVWNCVSAAIALIRRWGECQRSVHGCNVT